MLYLDNFQFADRDFEDNFFFAMRRTCYDTFYPFRLFSEMGWDRVDFEPITIFYGSNGSGKSTALNVIAEKIGAERETAYNRSNFFEDYVESCRANFTNERFVNNCIITSDGVFDCMLDIRNINNRIDGKREDLFDDYMELKYSHFQLETLNDIEKLKKSNLAKRKSQSKFVRNNLVNNVREYSNGESAFQYFIKKIDENGIYILDEPENSLSPERQLELVKYIANAARYFNCQFIISTHSPFILSIDGAKIYDLDVNPVDIRKWTSLENIKIYHDFFKKHEEEF